MQKILLLKIGRRLFIRIKTQVKLVRRVFDHTNNYGLIFGGSNNFEVERESGSVLIGKVPIIADNGEYTRVIGTVAVEYAEKDIYQNIYKRIKSILIASLIVLILGIIGGIF